VLGKDSVKSVKGKSTDNFSAIGRKNITLVHREERSTTRLGGEQKKVKREN